MTKRYLDGVRTLVLPDLHQEVAWARRVLEREASEHDHVVFLGDYFDAQRKGAAGVRETCAFLLEWLDRPNVSFLAGNHDIAYWESRATVLARRTPRRLLHSCSGFTASKAKRIHNLLPEEFWSRLELFTVVNGWFVSHAGLVLELWPEGAGTEEILADLAAQEQRAIHDLKRTVHPLLSVGRVRGGDADFGGLTWGDYRFEWPRDESGGVLPTPLPQLFGHVGMEHARNVGDSWCLDALQSGYASVGRSGEVRVDVA